MSYLQNHHVKLDFQNVDQHTEGKWLINDTKRRRVYNVRGPRATYRSLI